MKLSLDENDQEEIIKRYKLNEENFINSQE
jgi:hypothetical protein